MRKLLKNKLLSTWSVVYVLSNRSLKLWGGVTIASGLVAFVFDFAFAVSLQRFLTSIQLINGSAASPLFGGVREPFFEASLFLGIGALRAISIWLNSFSTGVCQASFEAGYRREIAQWALWCGNAPLGKVSTLFNDVVVGSAAVVSSSFYLISRFALIIATAIALATYSLTVTALVMLIVCLVVPLHRKLDRQINHASVVIQKSLSDVTDRLMVGVKNAVFFHIHGLFGIEIKEQRSLVGRYERASRRYYFLGSARGTFPQMVGLVVITAIATGGVGSLGRVKGDLVAYLYLVLRLFQGLSDAARVTANIRGNQPRLDVLARWWHEDYLPLQVRMNEGMKPFTNVVPISGLVGLSLCELSFGWHADSLVLSNVSVHCAPGTITVVFGPSGAGKTSMLLLLAGSMEPTAGSVKIHFPGGVQTMAEGRARLLASTAYVGPDPFVIPGTVRDFLHFGLDRQCTESELQAALRSAHCEFVFTLTDGLNHMLTEQGGGLSAGQKQRLSLARALLRSPRLLLLDEATANLDAASEAEIVETLLSLKGKTTIVAVTHREAMKRIADQLVELDSSGGAIVTHQLPILST